MCNENVTYSYDGVGNLLSVTDPLNFTTSYQYDELDRQVEQIDAEERTTSYSYDAVGNLLSITDPEANTTSYTYDLINRLLSDTNQLGDTESYEYDRVGNRVKQTDRNGREIVYDYDNLDRNSSEVWLDENGNPLRTANFNYDAASQLINADDPDSSYTYDYDEAGRLIEVDNAGTPDVPNVVFNYDYDAGDNLTTVTDTVDGIVKGTETFTYDELDRVTSITQSGDGIADKRVDYGYDAASQMTTVDRYSDLDGTNKVAQSNYTFDEAGRLTNLIHLKDATTLAAFAWVYDAANRITQYTSPDGTSDYNYDDTDQLLDANHDFQDDENYRYDENGNRTNPGYVTGENNRLLADRYYSYEYDSEGNRVSRTEIATGEVTEYEWDYRNRLVGVVVSDSDGNVIDLNGYTYDVFDRRIAKSVDGDGDGVGEAVVERFVHDGDHIALTFDGDGNETERFLHGVRIDEVLAQENAGGEVLWAIADHQGSVRLLMDNQGNVVNNITYDSFGNVTVETNAGNSFRFTYTGRELDPETGNYQYRSRFLDPLTGGFIQEDKIGFAGGDVNLSRYVGNSPLIYTDPFGFKRNLGGPQLLVGGGSPGAIGGAGPNPFRVSPSSGAGGRIGVPAGGGYRGVGLQTPNTSIPLIPPSGIPNQLPPPVTLPEQDNPQQEDRDSDNSRSWRDFFKDLWNNLNPFDDDNEPENDRQQDNQRNRDNQPDSEIRACPANLGDPSRNDDDDDDDDNRRELYRGDSRPPSEIFESGFQPRGTETDFERYVENNIPSIYVGTSKDFDVAAKYATKYTKRRRKPGLVYVIEDPGGGIDANAYYESRGRKNPFARDKEVAFPGGISTQDIRGVIPVGADMQPSGPEIRNPYYRER